MPLYCARLPPPHACPPTGSVAFSVNMRAHAAMPVLSVRALRCRMRDEGYGKRCAALRRDRTSTLLDLNIVEKQHKQTTTAPLPSKSNKH